MGINILEGDGFVLSRLISSMEPIASWATRWLRISKSVPGCYALSVSGMLSEEMQVSFLQLICKFLLQLMVVVILCLPLAAFVNSCRVYVNTTMCSMCHQGELHSQRKLVRLTVKSIPWTKLGEDKGKDIFKNAKG